MELTCDDFGYSGFLNGESCCPYCHQDDNLLSNVPVYPRGRSTLEAHCCCLTQNKVNQFDRSAWAKVVIDKRNRERC